jgi:hypothetical protein
MLKICYGKLTLPLSGNGALASKPLRAALLPGWHEAMCVKNPALAFMNVVHFCFEKIHGSAYKRYPSLWSDWSFLDTFSLDPVPPSQRQSVL